MAIPFTARNLQLYLQDLTGALTVRLGPGPGDGSLPEMAEGGKAVTSIYGEGDFMGRVYGQQLEGDVTITLHKLAQDMDKDEVENACMKLNTWASATTCDPGGEVWAPSVLIRGETQGVTWAYRWVSCRPRITGFTRGMEGCTISLALGVVGAPLRGAAALAWPS